MNTGESDAANLLPMAGDMIAGQGGALNEHHLRQIKRVKWIGWANNNVKLSTEEVFFFPRGRQADQGQNVKRRFDWWVTIWWQMAA